MNTLLSARHVSFEYSAKRALNDVTLDVHSGEIVVLLGVNGAGKSTLMRLVMGSLHPTSGELRVFGVDASKRRRADRSRVGYAPQYAAVWGELTCIEQLRFVGRLHRMSPRALTQRIPQLLEGLQLGEKAHVRAGELSGGMKQRLSLGVALLHEPELLLLDEPLAGLDPYNRGVVRDLLLSLSHTRGRSMVISTHDMHQAQQLATRVAILHRGELRAFDTLENLVERFRPSPSLDVTFADHATLHRALELIQTHRPFDTRIQLDAHTSKPSIALRSETPEQTLAQSMQFFREHHIETQHIHLQDSPLEEIFHTLTQDDL